MTLTPEDFAPLLVRCGPIDVVDLRGRGLTHATSGQIVAADAALSQVWSAQDLKLELFDELSRPVREISGADIVAIAMSAPGFVVTATDAVLGDPGPSISTRG